MSIKISYHEYDKNYILVLFLRRIYNKGTEQKDYYENAY